MVTEPTDAEQVIRAMAETVERSARSGPDVMRLRVWRQIDQLSKLAGVEVDIGKLRAQIMSDMDKERKANRGRQRKTDYNEPPAKLRQQFERTNRTTLVKGTKASAPSQVRYELQTPLERYKSDLTASEYSAIVSSIHDYCEAQKSVRVTGSYSAAGGGSSNRAGGVHDKARLAYTAVLHDLSVGLGGHPVLRRIYEGMVMGDMTAADVGKLMLPNAKDKVTLRAAGRTAIRLVAMLIEANRTREAGLRKGTIAGTHNLEAQITRELEDRRRRR